MLSYKKTIIVNKDFHNNEKQDNNSCWYSLARPLLSFKKFQETLLFITTLHFKKLKIIEIWYKIQKRIDIKSHKLTVKAISPPAKKDPSYEK